jgi:8-oxo-dGTP pyrophosphatase MutT (NUDIX family)
MNTDRNSINKNICNNCGKNGHLFHQCKLPITSYGIILFRNSEKGVQYLMIRRKDSFGYIDFIRGKYSPYSIEQIEKCVEEMSIEEKNRIVSESFDDLWRCLWGENNVHQYKSEEMISYKKFELIRNGIMMDNKRIQLSDIVDSSNTRWSETEWEFPKGRRNYQEKDLECALREFQEETGLSSDNIVIVDNVLPFEEIFVGSNQKAYKHKYYIAYMKKREDEYDMQQFQRSEVSKLEWKTYDECLESIRPYNLEKKNIIIKINKMLQEYRLYF